MKKMKPVALIIIALLIVVGALFGLGKLPFGKAKTGTFKIGLSMDSLADQRRINDKALFLAKAEELGAEVVTKEAGNDSNQQIKQIEELMGQNIDVLVVFPKDNDSLMSVVKTAIQKGIKVISYDKIVRNANVDLYITFDTEKIGSLMVESILKKVNKGRFVIINGDEMDQNATLMNYGIHAILDAKISSKEIEITKEIWAKDWNGKYAYDCVQSILASGAKIDGIIAGNDLLAEEAIKALAAHKLAGKIPVVGQEAVLASCQRVVEGAQLMTVHKPIKSLAEKAAEAAIHLAKTEPIGTELTTQDGTYNVPVITEDVAAVEKENMVEVMVNNQIFKLEDIYKNVPKEEWPKN